MPQAERLATQLIKTQNKLNSWIVPQYPTDSSLFLKYQREMRLKFSDANVLDILDDNGSFRVPDPGPNAGANARALAEIRQSLFDLKSKMVFSLLSMSFSENDDGFAHIAVDIESCDGVRAWRNLTLHNSRKRAKDKVARKLLFYQLKED